MNVAGPRRETLSGKAKAPILGSTVLIARPLWPVLRRIEPLLAEDGYRVVRAGSWSALLETGLSCEALAGVFLGEGGSVEEEFAVIHRFRERNGALGVPLVLVGGMNALLRAPQFRAAGIDLLIPADVGVETLMDQARPLLRYGALYQSMAAANRVLREQSLRDDLTGLPNRRYFAMDLARNVEMARRIGRPLSCIIADIDDFKRINDRYGHPGGDRVIRQFGAVMDRAKRTSDSVARLGGDEFAWLLVDADPGRALHAAARAHRIVRESVFQAEAEPLRLTATFGVSSIIPGIDLTADDLVGNADRALYWGKESGKDVIRFYPPKKAAQKADRDVATDRHVS
jgi:diguanylate cyclase (GGDEF)-like protein